MSAIACVGRIKRGKLHLVVDLAVFGKSVVDGDRNPADGIKRNGWGDGKFKTDSRQAQSEDDGKWCPVLETLISLEQCRKNKVNSEACFKGACIFCEEF